MRSKHSGLDHIMSGLTLTFLGGFLSFVIYLGLFRPHAADPSVGYTSSVKAFDGVVYVTAAESLAVHILFGITIVLISVTIALIARRRRNRTRVDMNQS